MQNNTQNVLLIPQGYCPRCNHHSAAVLVPAAAKGDPGLPKSGDFVLCDHCNEPLIFDQLMFRRQLTGTERVLFWMQHPDAAQWSATVRLATHNARLHGFAQA